MIGKMIKKTIQLNSDLVKQINFLSRKEDRDFDSSLRLALRVGLVALQNPKLTAPQIKEILETKTEAETKAELEAEEELALKPDPEPF